MSTTDDIQKEASEILSQYLRCNTTNPPGNETVGADFLKSVLEKEGIACELFESAPGRVSLRAELPASDATADRPAILLQNHSDVVPANREKWGVDPFGGDIRDGFIYGRGALDMKGVGVAQLMTLILLKRRKVALKRPVIFLAAADEEQGGHQGTEWLLKNHPKKFNAALVLDEGGLGLIERSKKKPTFYLAVGEKGSLWVRLKVSGDPGHSSVPHPRNANLKLLKILRKILKPQPIRWTPPMIAMFRYLSRHEKGLKKFLMSHPKGLTYNPFFRFGLAKKLYLNATLRNTVTLTGLQSGEGVNFIPNEASATLDIRLLPGETPEHFLEMLKTRAGPGVAWEVLSQSHPSSSPFSAKFAKTVETILHTQYPDIALAPCLITVATDSRFYRQQGIPAYGVMPFVIDEDDLGGVHGNNERLSVENLGKGISILFDLVKTLATTV